MSCGSMKPRTSSWARERSWVHGLSIDEAIDALETIAKAMGFAFANTEDYVYFACGDGLEDAPRKPIGSIYGKAGVPSPGLPYRSLLEDCVHNRKKFGRSILNPFFGCESLEEVLIRADLVGKKTS